MNFLLFDFSFLQQIHSTFYTKKFSKKSQNQHSFREKEIKLSLILNIHTNKNTYTIIIVYHNNSFLLHFDTLYYLNFPLYNLYVCTLQNYILMH